MSPHKPPPSGRNQREGPEESNASANPAGDSDSYDLPDVDSDEDRVDDAMDSHDPGDESDQSDDSETPGQAAEDIANREGLEEKGRDNARNFELPLLGMDTENRKLLRKHASIYRRLWIYGKTAKIMDEWRTANDELLSHGYGKPRAGVGLAQKSGVLLSEPLMGVIVMSKAKYYEWADKSNKSRDEAAITALEELMTSRPYYTGMSLRMTDVISPKWVLLLQKCFAAARSSKAQDQEWKATYSSLFDEEIRKTQIWQDILYRENAVKAKMEMIGNAAAPARDRTAAQQSLRAFKDTLAETNELYGVNKKDHTMPMDPIRALCDTNDAGHARELLKLITTAMYQLGLGEFVPGSAPQPDADHAFEILGTHGYPVEQLRKTYLPTPPESRAEKTHQQPPSEAQSDLEDETSARNGYNAGPDMRGVDTEPTPDDTHSASDGTSNTEMPDQPPSQADTASFMHSRRRTREGLIVGIIFDGRISRAVVNRGLHGCAVYDIVPVSRIGTLSTFDKDADQLPLIKWERHLTASDIIAVKGMVQIPQNFDRLDRCRRIAVRNSDEVASRDPVVRVRYPPQPVTYFSLEVLDKNRTLRKG
ncbi:hypothetical protein B0A48_18509 [Cryoendolithus antarcticus]|uniref:Uncharacterized protein n=1 Tax=Cryoendolithus antarcticus TaxID=1507870 RepID=A0A1V8S8Q6_9PEZI|nr:hypothetical protein B0A48_18509 [Cryoendolithus antarcticus]